VNALLPLPARSRRPVSEEVKSGLLNASVVVPPLLWLVSPEADAMTGRRLVATNWQGGCDGRSAADAATEQAGW
jgi:3-oxoacyl-[acyl-carrier protein] reductase